jgi:putative transposase
MNYALTELKEQTPFLRNYHSKMLQMVAKKIATANKALKALCKNGHKIGKLKYLQSDEYNSFTYNQSGFDITSDNQLWLSKIGKIRIKLHRKVQNIKQVTVKREGKHRWYAIICCELTEPIFKFIDISKSVGIDVGITKFVHDSDNHEVDNPLFLKKMLNPLRRASRHLSRRQKGSANYEKAKSRLQILHERIRNQRMDFLHKQSTIYSKRYDLIFLEKLRVLNMTKNHRLARAILDSGWVTFGSMLKYKAKKVMEVYSPNTSVDCSYCGNKVQKSLAVRIHRCNKCSIVLDRDYNAAINILQRGLQALKLPMERREVTPVEFERTRKQESIEAHDFSHG